MSKWGKTLIWGWEGLGRAGETCKQSPVRSQRVLGEGCCDCHQPPPCLWSPQLWVEERLPLAQSSDYGINLQTVQLFMKKNQVSAALLCQSSQPALPHPALQKASYSRLLFLLIAVGSPDP